MRSMPETVPVPESDVPFEPDVASQSDQGSYAKFGDLTNRVESELPIENNKVDGPVKDDAPERRTGTRNMTPQINSRSVLKVMRARKRSDPRLQRK